MTTKGSRSSLIPLHSTPDGFAAQGPAVYLTFARPHRLSAFSPRGRPTGPLWTSSLGEVTVESHGTIVNSVSMMALAPVPVMPSYAISKAATFNMMQSFRALLAPKGVRVQAMLAGPVDTDMLRGLEVPKATPQSVAEAIFDGVERGEEEIFPDAMSINLADSWRTGAVKEFEHQFAAFVNPQPIA